MEGIDFINLRLQIEMLIYSRAQLIEENKLLRDKLAKASQSHMLMLGKKEHLSQKLRSLVSNLKEELL